MKIILWRLVPILLVLGGLVFAPQAWAVIACSSAQLKNPALAASCAAKQATINQQNALIKGNCANKPPGTLCPAPKSPN